jgi:transcriptional regulator of arginine metabolism
MYIYKRYMNINTLSERRRMIHDIVKDHGVRSQAELLRELRSRGMRTTQATLSRDLREMGYVKVSLGSGEFRYEALDPASAAGSADRLKLLFESFVLDLQGTGNLMLVKTTPGNAHGVASLIDTLRIRGILGTVAGDDTILVVLDTLRSCRRVEKEFRALMA